MSEENVKHARRVIELSNRGDIDGALELAADDYVLDMSNAIGPDKGIYRGKEKVRDLFTSARDAVGELRWEAPEIIEVDEERLIVVLHVFMRGRGSGAEVDAVSAALWTISDGKGRSMKMYQSKADALEAAGLSE